MAVARKKNTTIEVQAVIDTVWTGEHRAAGHNYHVDPNTAVVLFSRSMAVMASESPPERAQAETGGETATTPVARARARGKAAAE